MNENLESTTKNIKERAQAKSMVVEATRKALDRIDTLHRIGEANVLAAMTNVNRDVGEYVSGGAREKISDLRNIAQDAAEGVLRKLGYTDAAMMADFNAVLNKQLNLPADGE